VAPASTPTAKPDRPDQAVAVGRTGVMPTLPDHAHAAVSMPPGIARRFPSPAAGSMPITAPSENPQGAETALPLLRIGDVGGEPAPIVMSTTTPEVVPVPTQVQAAPEPVNDIAVPDVPVTGVPIDEKPAADAPVVVPKFDNAAPTELDRLSAIAPPTISNADDPSDKNDTTDTLVTTHDDVRAEATPQAAAAATQSTHSTRSERADHTDHVNGLAAPLRTALRDRTTPKRDGSFELTIRLDPPELGVVRVRVFTQGDQVKITMHSDSPEARTVLQERRDDVKTILRNEGFNLDGFDVETDDGRHQGSDQPQRRRNNAAADQLADFAAPSFVDDGALRL
jgi:hypothetical protein